jgi:hypothetical protein
VGQLERLAEALGEHLQRLDGLLDAARTVPFVSDFVRERVGEPDEELSSSLEGADEFARRSVRSLTLTSMVLDLPEETRESQAVQGRIEALAPEIDAAVLQTAQLLSSCPEQDLQGVEAALRDDPTLAMRVCEMVDQRGQENGLGRSGRRRLRTLGRRVTNYLRDEPLSSLVDQCQSVVAAALVEHGTVLDSDTRRHLEAQARAFWSPDSEGTEWAFVKSPEEGRGAGWTTAEHLPCIDPSTEGYTVTGRCEAPGVEHTPSGDAELDDDDRDDIEYRRWRANRVRGGRHPAEAQERTNRLVRSGAITLGIGAGLTVIGGATLPLTDGITAFLLTIGGVLLIVGIILIAIGASRRAAERRGER